MGLGVIPRLGLRVALRGVNAAAREADAEYRWVGTAPSEAQLRRIGELIDHGHVKVVMDSVYPLDRFREAFAKLESGRATGKIVLRLVSEETAAQP